MSIDEQPNHNTYIISNQGFEFEFENIIYTDAIFGVSRARYECDYLSQVINSEEIANYIVESDFTINRQSGKMLSTLVWWTATTIRKLTTQSKKYTVILKNSKRLSTTTYQIKSFMKTRYRLTST